MGGIVEDKTLSDNKSEFIKRLERELESSSVAKKITYPSPEDALNSILNYSQNHFMQFSDLREYDFNILIMHGREDGKIYYQNDMIAEISTIKSKFEERKYNSAMNYFFSCYMEGYSILAGVRKPLLQISNDCEIIKFTPSAPFYSNYDQIG